MKIIQILEFIYRWGLQHQLNKNDNIWKFKNKTLPLSSQIDCENGAQYKIEGVILRDRCSVRVRNGGILNIGNNVAFNNNCTLTCRGKKQLDQIPILDPIVRFLIMTMTICQRIEWKITKLVLY